jgi:hypothetical protein
MNGQSYIKKSAAINILIGREQLFGEEAFIQYIAKSIKID